MSHRVELNIDAPFGGIEARVVLCFVMKGVQNLLAKENYHDSAYHRLFYMTYKEALLYYEHFKTHHLLIT